MALAYVDCTTRRFRRSKNVARGSKPCVLTPSKSNSFLARGAGDLPGIQRAVAFFVTNLNWTLKEMAEAWVVLRTARAADTRPFAYFLPF